MLKNAAAQTSTATPPSLPCMPRPSSNFGDGEPLTRAHIVDSGACAALRGSLATMPPSPRRSPLMPLLAPVPVRARLKRRVTALVRRLALRAEVRA